MKNKANLISPLLLVLLILSFSDLISAQNLAGKKFSGEVVSENSGKKWHMVLSFSSHNQSSGDVSGEIVWTSLNSTHRIEGKLKDQQLRVKEVSHIIKGAANLNCVYIATIVKDRIYGEWYDPNSDGGVIDLYEQKKDINSVNNGKQMDTGDDARNGHVLIKGVYGGKVFSGNAISSKSGKAWPVNLKFTSYIQSTGAVVGEIEWPSLNAVHRFEGIYNIDNLKFTFKEVAYIKKGGANLNCEYKTIINWDDLSGTWTDPGSDNGTIKLTMKDSGESQVDHNAYFIGSIYSGKAVSTNSGRSWPVSLKISSYDQATGIVGGQLEWSSLNAVHSINGKLNQQQFHFKEVGYIKEGGANLNCEYSTTMNKDEITGTWTDPSSDIGTIRLYKK